MFSHTFNDPQSGRYTYKRLYCTHMPFHFEVEWERDACMIAGGIISTEVGHQTTLPSGTPNDSLLPRVWRVADLLYNTDTLFVCIDGKPIACHGFGPNSHISLSETGPKKLIIGGSNPRARFAGQITAAHVDLGTPADLDCF